MYVVFSSILHFNFHCKFEMNSNKASYVCHTPRYIIIIYSSLVNSSYNFVKN